MNDESEDWHSEDIYPEQNFYDKYMFDACRLLMAGFIGYFIGVCV